LAAKIGEGITQWAELNCDLNQTACARMFVLTVPQMFLFLKGVAHRYTETRVARLIVNWAAGYANDTAAMVGIGNFSIEEGSSLAILFSEKEEIPKVWGAVERVLNRSDIGFYVSRDRDLQKKLGLTEFPGVYAFHRGQFRQYSGRIDVNSVVRFFRGVFDEPNGRLRDSE
jgi:hypothetical protein